MVGEIEPEPETDADKMSGYMDSAKEALGFDIPTLLTGMMEANAEDATFRAEVIKRFDVLIKNQQRIYAAVVGDVEQE